MSRHWQARSCSVPQLLDISLQMMQHKSSLTRVAGVSSRPLALGVPRPTGRPQHHRIRPQAGQDAEDAIILRAERGPTVFSVHGRHVQVDENLRDAVIDRLVPVIEKMSSPEFVEGAGGGVSHVDVRLMHTAAEIHLNPVYMDKSSHALHDTYVRQGHLSAQVSKPDGNTWECFEEAAEQLEHKLKPQHKGAPRKMDYRSFNKGGNVNSTGGKH